MSRSNVRACAFTSATFFAVPSIDFRDALVANVLTVELLDQVVAIGSSHAEDCDKFAATGLTAGKSRRVKAPLINECYANFDRRLFDDRIVNHQYILIS
jgi:flavin reductase (DIM6/NTAB) family NADH-FMN oxidoreductase RutF